MPLFIAPILVRRVPSLRLLLEGGAPSHGPRSQRGDPPFPIAPTPPTLPTLPTSLKNPMEWIHFSGLHYIWVIDASLIFSTGIYWVLLSLILRNTFRIINWIIKRSGKGGKPGRPSYGRTSLPWHRISMVCSMMRTHGRCLTRMWGGGVAGGPPFRSHGPESASGMNRRPYQHAEDLIRKYTIFPIVRRLRMNEWCGATREREPLIEPTPR